MPQAARPEQILLLLLLAAASGSRSAPTTSEPPFSLFPAPQAESIGKQYWLDQGQSAVFRAEEQWHRALMKLSKPAKHVILFVGDGMGVTTVTAARILKGQLANASGEEAQLAFEQFPHTGLAKTYNTDYQTADSAGTATAFLTGVKTRSGLLGLSAGARRGNCSSVTDEARLKSFLRLAADEGRAVGLVTTTRLTHATPAATYSQSVDRGWEFDAKVPLSDRAACPDIARQLVDNAADFRVLLGGGRKNFLPNSAEYRGNRLDGRNLVEQWKNKQSDYKRAKFNYIESRDQLMNLRANATDSVLGLLADSHLRFHRDNIEKSNASTREPTLAEMTAKALELLTVYGDNTGFVLLVEAGRIDHGHHENQANHALHDTVALSDAVDAAVELLKRKNLLDDTLMMVTADHSHVFTMGHYGMRGQPISELKYQRDAKTGSLTLAKLKDKLPLTLMNYADGRSAQFDRAARWNSSAGSGGNKRPKVLDSANQAYLFPAMMYNENGESHGAEDVPVFARGPGSHLVQGVHEQTHVAHVIMRAARLGPYAKAKPPPAFGSPFNETDSFATILAYIGKLIGAIFGFA